MSLRVISGSAKGRKLKDPPGKTTRPVTDKVKQAVFNIIGQDVIDSTWWDVFGGTGAIGIEALSRGASFVRFCELNRLPLEIINSNLQICGFSENAEVIRTDAFKMLTSSPDRKFDYIYIAPPQYHGLWIQSLTILDENASWLEEDGWILVQINPVEEINIPLRNLTRFDERKYGSTKLLFYQLSN
jgi:16S rRNA (guanine(966)-N(2))-methyltransferase RsmD